MSPSGNHREFSLSEVRRAPSLCAVLLFGDDLRAEMAREQFGVRLGRLVEVAVVAAHRGIAIVVSRALRGPAGRPDALAAPSPAALGSTGAEASAAAGAPTAGVLTGGVDWSRADGFGVRIGADDGLALTSTIVSILKSAPSTTTIASLSTSSLPPRAK